MSRRADPERIYQARGYAVRNRLAGHGMPPDLLEQWIRAWEVEAADRGLDRLTAAFWDGAGQWIGEQRTARRLPK